ncbi:MAG TPA: rhodanese-like domain-containing protein [Elusimicrobiota bacterium]|nr:rhodanese-like domain-containing protein [Elusimicrobiota bacterium]
MNRVSAAQLKERLAAADPPQLLDVREAFEFEAEHIPGALLAPLSRLKAAAAAVDRARPAVVICRSGARACRAAETLATEGFAVEVLEGGMLAWAAAGGAVARGESRVWSMERQVRFFAGSIVALGTVAGWAWRPGLLGIPLFIGCGLVFSAVTDTCGMALFLARLPWNRGKADGCAPKKPEGPCT